MNEKGAVALVFGSSAAVLVVELVALRLLAPYLGLTLETSTLVIGLALSAIALGSWAGGRAADRVPPRRTLGPLLGISGVVVALTPLLVRGGAETGAGTLVVPAAIVTIVVPGALLSAITPMVTKLQLTSLEETGTVVGRLSGIATAGSIAGTVVTGFFLVSLVPVSSILVALGVTLVLCGVLVDWRVRGWRTVAAPVALLVLGGLGAAAAPGGCDVETTYHCAVVQQDPERDGGLVLVLDGVRHSYVDPGDPTHLEFAYVRAAAAAIDSVRPAGEPLEAYHLGGGGLTLPRWLEATRPGTRSLVSEIDQGVVDLDVERLGLETGPDLEVRVEDGRLGIERLDDAAYDVVVGDAFGGLSVPWHLTTLEAVREVRRVLVDDGAYVQNLIDRGPLAFARAELATLDAVFEHVALLADPATLAREDGGNLVVLASPAPLDLEQVQAGLDERGTGWGLLTGADLREWVDGAEVLTDDHAPVDQLLTPYG